MFSKSCQKIFIQIHIFIQLLTSYYLSIILFSSFPLWSEGKESIAKLILDETKIKQNFKLLPQKLGKCIQEKAQLQN